jgi:pyruvate/2-oxoglutarate dehydrogenase complex dihydrolipoamide acyltransferase (E2) component
MVGELAGENAIDLSTIKGTGVGGRKQDVLAVVDERQKAAPRPPRRRSPGRGPARASWAGSCRGRCSIGSRWCVAATGTNSTWWNGCATESASCATSG